MKYRNKTTGAVIDVASPVKSPDWVQEKPKAVRRDDKGGKGKEVAGDEDGKTEV